MGTETCSDRAHKSWDQSLMLGWSEPSCTNGVAQPQAMAGGPTILPIFLPQEVAGSSWRCRQELLSPPLAVSFQYHSTYSRHGKLSEVLPGSCSCVSTPPLSCLHFLIENGYSPPHGKRLFIKFSWRLFFLSSLRFLNPCQSLKVLTWPGLYKSIIRFPFKEKGHAPQTDFAKRLA